MKPRKQIAGQCEFALVGGWLERQRLDAWLRSHSGKVWVSPVCSVVRIGGGK